MRYITPAQRERKNQKERDRRKKERKENKFGLGKEFKRPETSGISASDSDWYKQLYNLSSIVGKACDSQNTSTSPCGISIMGWRWF